MPSLSASDIFCPVGLLNTGPATYTPDASAFVLCIFTYVCAGFVCGCVWDKIVAVTKVNCGALW